MNKVLKHIRKTYVSANLQVLMKSFMKKSPSLYFAQFSKAFDRLPIFLLSSNTRKSGSVYIWSSSLYEKLDTGYLISQKRKFI